MSIQITRNGPSVDLCRIWYSYIYPNYQKWPLSRSMKNMVFVYMFKSPEMAAVVKVSINANMTQHCPICKDSIEYLNAGSSQNCYPSVQQIFPIFRSAFMTTRKFQMGLLKELKQYLFCRFESRHVRICYFSEFPGQLLNHKVRSAVASI